jgi:hypothetical protein
MGDSIAHRNSPFFFPRWNCNSKSFDGERRQCPFWLHPLHGNSPDAAAYNDTDMLINTIPEHDSMRLMVIESGLAAIIFLLPLGWPNIGARWFPYIERPFARFARKKNWSVAAVGLTAFLLRLAILPICPIPLPFCTDDFSFLLAADTFLHGRLTNPTPAMWVHFETIHVSMQPTYMSMYFPAQGLLLAAGKVLFGHPWYALLITSALMCAALCWMLQAWLPPTWALLGGIVAILHLGLFSYWINTYHTAATITALGGALILGALPRFKKHPRYLYSLLMGIGVALIVLARPYEGVLLCLPVAGSLGYWLCFGKNRPSPAAALRFMTPPLAFIVAAVAWLGYYDYRAFGSPFTLPYTVNRATYAMAPYFVWQHLRPEPAYRNEELRRFYGYEGEAKFFLKVHSPYGFIPNTLLKAVLGTMFFSGAALLIPLIMLRRVLLDRRTRFLVLCLLILMAGLVIEIYLLPHYIAPFTAVFYALGLQAMRHLRLWKFAGKPVGLTWTRLAVTLCVVMAGVRVCARPLHVEPQKFPAFTWNYVWYGPGHFGTERNQVETALEKLPGKQIAIVRYAPDHIDFDEWVYNSADIDGSKVIWAQDMDAAKNLELIHYYQDRKVWLVERGRNSIAVSPYPVTDQAAATLHD